MTTKSRPLATRGRHEAASARCERLVALVQSLRGRRIVVVGDIVCDRFVYGDIVRVSREAPALILEQRRVSVSPGGAGNCLANLRALGARPRAVGLVGRDENGRSLLERLRGLGCTTGGVLQLSGYETPTKSRVLAGGVHTRRQQIVRLDHGTPRGELQRAVRDRLRDALARRLSGAEGLLVADYGYGAASPAFLAPVLAGLRRAALPIAVDSRSRVAEFRGFTACTPNLEELESAVGSRELTRDEDVVRAARALARRSTARIVLATLGGRGMCLVRPRRAPQWIPAHGSGEVADVTGAGDTVIAVFTLALAAGADPIDAAALANYAAGIVVTKAGTATVTPEELATAIRTDLAR